MEASASPTQLIPEQIWDSEDLPQLHLKRGRATGSAMPLLWAHAEYIRLLRSRQEGRVFDRIPCVANRYLEKRPAYRNIQFWSFNSPAKTVKPGQRLRITAFAAFRLHWSADNWQTISNSDSARTTLGIYFVDLTVADGPKDNPAPVRFTFFWKESSKWEGRDFEIAAIV